jgi:ferritin-like metal-binding protein YciE
MSAYGTVRTYATLLGQQAVGADPAAELDEEKQTDAKLNGLAEHINVEAKAA